MRLRSRPGLRPRAGRLATGLFLAGLAASAAVAVTVGLRPAQAQSVGSAIDQPTAGTLPAGASTVRGTTDVRSVAVGPTPVQGDVNTSVDVMDKGSATGRTTRPMKHLSGSSR